MRTQIIARLVVMAVAACELGSSPRTHAAHSAWDFDFTQPAGIVFLGDAGWNMTGGNDDSGVVQLTRAGYPNVVGSMVIPALDEAEAVVGFTATFKMLIGRGTGADGLSFNCLPEPPSQAFGEEGNGAGLTVSFDTYDNAADEAPAIDIKVNGITAASQRVPVELLRTETFIDVLITVTSEGLAWVLVSGFPIHEDVPLDWTPPPAPCFALGARTGLYTDDHFIDDLAIRTLTDLPAHPVVRSVSPRGGAVRGDALLSARILNGSESTVVVESLTLTVDGFWVPAFVSLEGDWTTISHQPADLFLPLTAHEMEIAFRDSAGRSHWLNHAFLVADYFGPGGNAYEVVLVPGPPVWKTAREAAQQRTFAGRPGHLATITTAEEDAYVEQLVRAAFAGTDLSRAWIGGYQDPVGSDPTENWQWIHGEGPIAGVNDAETYANWLPGEPNDYWGPGSEECLEVRFSGIYGWNDAMGEDIAAPLGGYGADLAAYVVEYESCGVPREVTESLTLDCDIYVQGGDGLLICADDITINGAGHKLIGPGAGRGIVLVGRRGVIITDLVIRGFDVGVDVQGGEENIIKSNYLLDNHCGLSFEETSRNAVLNNVMTKNGTGVLLASSASDNLIHYNMLLGNAVEMQDFGANSWDDPESGVGNFWGDYWGEDDGSNGRIAGDYIGDTALPHAGVDNYPMLDPSIAMRFRELPFGDDWWDRASWLVWRGGWSPVDIRVVDPMGRTLSSQINEIGLNAFFIEDELSVPGSKQVLAIVVVPLPLTAPSVAWFFEMNALADLTYSMDWFVSVGDATTGTGGQLLLERSVINAPLMLGQRRVLGVDLAGDSAFPVPQYAFGGILQPINADGSSVFKQGSTIPVKFQLWWPTGLSVEDAHATISTHKIAEGIAGTADEAVSTAAASVGNVFRYDPPAQQYIFNLSTKSLTAGTYMIRISLDDGQIHDVRVSLRSR